MSPSDDDLWMNVALLAYGAAILLLLCSRLCQQREHSPEPQARLVDVVPGAQESGAYKACHNPDGSVVIAVVCEPCNDPDVAGPTSPVQPA